MTPETKIQNRKKTGILFFNLGGPDSLDAVAPFLYNLFSDPDIIRLPFSEILQKPIAWWITTSRIHEVKKSYGLMGGRSPIVPLTEAQARGLEAELAAQGHDVKVYIAMRYWHPFTEEAVDEILKDGVEHLILLPLYPQYSLTTTGSSVNELNRILAEHHDRRPDRPLPSLELIQQYYDHPDYLNSLAEVVTEGLEKNNWSCPREKVQLVFSAHSLPEKFVKKTGDIYPKQIVETIKLLIERHFPGQPWELCYQSKVGDMKWLGPDTDGMLHYCAATGVDNILMVPISFVSDHLETLYEIDHLYLGLARELKIPHCYRAESLNARPTFIKALAQIVQPYLSSKETASLAAV